MLGRGWWMPPAFAVLALLLLLVVPAVVDRRIVGVRGKLTFVSEHGRILVNDLEASFAGELLVRNTTTGPEAIPRFATRAQRDSDQAALHDAVREISPEAEARYHELADRLTVWDATPHDGTVSTEKQGLEVLASAERLDSLLTTVTEARRSEVQALERWYVVTPAVLTPIALIAVGLVRLAGRRTLHFARLP